MVSKGCRRSQSRTKKHNPKGNPFSYKRTSTMEAKKLEDDDLKL
jgi:hypothetical protein